MSLGRFLNMIPSIATEELLGPRPCEELHKGEHFSSDAQYANPLFINVIPGRLKSII